jgi:hypothetical protein
MSVRSRAAYQEPPARGTSNRLHESLKTQPGTLLDRKAIAPAISDVGGLLAE